uniref:Uncharacterized protein n=1 Tax=Amorphochlora amoebiformis TaxID=1561963 RepID=A0A7S0DI47_9EUKA|mmetsp:Transcript_28792/g.45987  ORF Transcript_28792/g.45987 Transcript_28792/m.45987 type:complete len:1624 (+) Transcript_28792:215-5086(+)
MPSSRIPKRLRGDLGDHWKPSSSKRLRKPVDHLSPSPVEKENKVRPRSTISPKPSKLKAVQVGKNANSCSETSREISPEKKKKKKGGKVLPVSQASAALRVGQRTNVVSLSTTTPLVPPSINPSPSPPSTVPHPCQNIVKSSALGGEGGSKHDPNTFRNLSQAYVKPSRGLRILVNFEEGVYGGTIWGVSPYVKQAGEDRKEEKVRESQGGGSQKKHEGEVEKFQVWVLYDDGYDEWLTYPSKDGDVAILPGTAENSRPSIPGYLLGQKVWAYIQPDEVAGERIPSPGEIGSQQYWRKAAISNLPIADESNKYVVKVSGWYYDLGLEDLRPRAGSSQDEEEAKLKKKEETLKTKIVRLRAHQSQGRITAFTMFLREYNGSHSSPADPIGDLTPTKAEIQFLALPPKVRGIYRERSRKEKERNKIKLIPPQDLKKKTDVQLRTAPSSKVKLGIQKKKAGVQPVTAPSSKAKLDVVNITVNLKRKSPSKRRGRPPKISLTEAAGSSNVSILKPLGPTLAKPEPKPDPQLKPKTECKLLFKPDLKLKAKPESKVESAPCPSPSNRPRKAPRWLFSNSAVPFAGAKAGNKGAIKLVFESCPLCGEEFDGDSYVEKARKHLVTRHSLRAYEKEEARREDEASKKNGHESKELWHHFGDTYVGPSAVSSGGLGLWAARSYKGPKYSMIDGKENTLTMQPDGSPIRIRRSPANSTSGNGSPSRKRGLQPMGAGDIIGRYCVAKEMMDWWEFQSFYPMAKVDWSREKSAQIEAISNFDGPYSDRVMMLNLDCCDWFAVPFGNELKIFERQDVIEKLGHAIIGWNPEKRKMGLDGVKFAVCYENRKKSDQPLQHIGAYANDFAFHVTDDLLYWEHSKNKNNAIPIPVLGVDPRVSKEALGNGKVLTFIGSVLMASKDIKEGDEIGMCYGPGASTSKEFVGQMKKGALPPLPLIPSECILDDGTRLDSLQAAISSMYKFAIEKGKAYQSKKYDSNVSPAPEGTGEMEWWEGLVTKKRVRSKKKGNARGTRYDAWVRGKEKSGKEIKIELGHFRVRSEAEEEVRDFTHHPKIRPLLKKKSRVIFNEHATRLEVSEALGIDATLLDNLPSDPKACAKVVAEAARKQREMLKPKYICPSCSYPSREFLPPGSYCPMCYTVVAKSKPKPRRRKLRRWGPQRQVLAEVPSCFPGQMEWRPAVILEELEPNSSTDPDASTLTAKLSIAGAGPNTATTGNNLGAAPGSNRRISATTGKGDNHFGGSDVSVMGDRKPNSKPKTKTKSKPKSKPKSKKMSPKLKSKHTGNSRSKIGSGRDSEGKTGGEEEKGKEGGRKRQREGAKGGKSDVVKGRASVSPSKHPRSKGDDDKILESLRYRVEFLQKGGRKASHIVSGDQIWTDPVEVLTSARRRKKGLLDRVRTLEERKKIKHRKGDIVVMANGNLFVIEAIHPKSLAEVLPLTFEGETKALDDQTELTIIPMRGAKSRVVRLVRLYSVPAHRVEGRKRVWAIRKQPKKTDSEEGDTEEKKVERTRKRVEKTGLKRGGKFDQVLPEGYSLEATNKYRTKRQRERLVGQWLMHKFSHGWAFGKISKARGDSFSITFDDQKRVCLHLEPNKYQGDGDLHDQAKTGAWCVLQSLR